MTSAEPPVPEPAAVGQRRKLRTARLEAFSDGVFAIAVTLLVLDIAAPARARSGADLLHSVARLWPSYLAYVVSFSTIGAAWLGHNAITEYLERIDAAFVRLNLVVLLLVSFLPLPTRLLADNIGQAGPERVAATIYGANLVLAVAMLLVLWRYAVRAGLVRPDAADEEIQLLTKRLIPGLTAYLVLIAAGIFVPVVAVGGYLAIALYFIIPFRHRFIVSFRRRRDRPRHQDGQG
jgi:uncharacterized membrane protein